jgi:hypothetical protein
MTKRDTKIGDTIHVSVVFNLVRIEIECADEYQAQVAYDDIVQRMENGGQLSISYGHHQPTAAGQVPEDSK